MSAQLLRIEGSQLKIEVTIDLSRSMLTSEENIQQTLNEIPGAWQRQRRLNIWIPTVQRSTSLER